MAYYLVRATLDEARRKELRERLNSGEIQAMRPFGEALQLGLENARLLDNGEAIWEEEDYCSPPLAMERRAVLDDYFTGLTVETVNEGEGWNKIEALPRLWEA